MTTDVYPVAHVRTPGEGETQTETGQGQPNPDGESTRFVGLAPETLNPRQPRRHRRRWLQRRKREPWLKCLHCKRRLVPISVWQGWTRVRIGRAYSEGDTKMVCPHCLTVVRKFETRQY